MLPGYTGPDVHFDPRYVSDTTTFDYNFIGAWDGQALLGEHCIWGTSSHPPDPGFEIAPADVGNNGWTDDPTTSEVDESADNIGDLHIAWWSGAINKGSDELSVCADPDRINDELYPLLFRNWATSALELDHDIDGDPRAVAIDSQVAPVDMGADEDNGDAVTPTTPTGYGSLQWVHHGLAVAEGGTVTLTTAHLLALDANDYNATQTFTFTGELHGQFQELSEGVWQPSDSTFTLEQLLKGQVRFVHNGDEQAQYTAPVTVVNASGSAMASFTFAIGVANDAPVLTVNRLVILEDDIGGAIVLTEQNIAATDNDSDDLALLFTVSDVEHGVFRNAHTWAPVVTFSQADVANGDIEFVHQPVGSEWLPPSYKVTVSDGELQDGPHPASIIYNFPSIPEVPPVTPSHRFGDGPVVVNRPPIAFEPGGDPETVNYTFPKTDGTVTYYGDIGFDPDGDSITVVLLTIGGNGSPECQLYSEGSIARFAFRPEANWTGWTGVVYTIEDAYGALTTGHFAVEIASPDQHHFDYADDDEYETTAGGSLTLDPSLFENDDHVTGEDAHFLWARVFSGPANGRLKVNDSYTFETISADDTVVYEPNPGFSGEDYFWYQGIWDGFWEETWPYFYWYGGNDLARVTIDVSLGDTEPLTTQTFSTVHIPEDTTVRLPDILSAHGWWFDGTVYDLEGRALSMGPVACEHGTLQLNEHGIFTYTPHLNYYGPDTVTCNVTNGSITVGATIPIYVDPVNDAPVVDLNCPHQGSDFAAVFMEGSEGVLALAENATLADVDNADLEWVTVRLLNHPDGSAEWLSVDAGTSGITHSYNPSTGILTLAKTAPNATVDDYEEVLRTVRYHNTSNAPSTTTREIQFTAYDGVLASEIATTMLTVVARNDLPVVDLNGTADGTNAEATFTAGAGAVAVALAPNATLLDDDHTTLDWVQIAFVGNRPDGEAEILSADPGATGISVTYNATTGVLLLTKACPKATVADYQQVLQTVSYNNTKMDAATSRRVLSVRVSDGTDVTEALAQITILGVNNPPMVKDLVFDVWADTPGAPGQLNGQLVGFDLYEGSVLTYSLADGSDEIETSLGTLYVAADGQFTYNSKAGVGGIDTITYKAFDGQDYSNLGTLTFWVRPSVPGDANLDGWVTDHDAAIMAENWLKRGNATWADGDFNLDGDVDDRDAAILAAHWLRIPEGAEIASHPDLAPEAPRVESVWVANSGVTNSTVAIPHGLCSDAQLRPLAVYHGVNQVILQFTEVLDSTPAELVGCLTLVDPNTGTTFSPTSAAKSTDGKTVTWTFGTTWHEGEWVIRLSDDMTAGGIHLDGEWSDPPRFLGDTSNTNSLIGGLSGDFLEGGDYQFAFSLLLPGDVNRDGVVDAVDADVVARNLGRVTPAVWADGDFDGDGDVDDTDLATLAAHWHDAYWPAPSAGDVDWSFGNLGKATATDFGEDGCFWGGDMVILPGGQIVIVGTIEYSADWMTDFAIAMFNPDGTPCLGFFGDGTTTVDTDLGVGYDDAIAVTVQDADSFIVAGTSDGLAMVRFRFDHDTQTWGVDTTFDAALDGAANADGIVLVSDAIGMVADVAVGPDGMVYIAGGLNDDMAVVRFDPATGDYDTLVIDHPGYYDQANAVLVQPDGKIVFGGCWGKDSSAHYAYVSYRYTYDNGWLVDTTWGGTGRVETALFGGTTPVSATLSDMVYYQDATGSYPDRIITVGGGGALMAAYDVSNGAARFTSNATPTSTVDANRHVILTATGQIVTAGYKWFGLGDYEFAIRRYNIDGILDASFGDNGCLLVDFRSDYYAVAEDTEGGLVLGGFTQWNSGLALTRLHGDVAGPKVTQVQVAHSAVAGSAIGVPTLAGDDAQLMPLPIYDLISNPLGGGVDDFVGGINQVILTFDEPLGSSAAELRGALMVTEHETDTEYAPTSAVISADGKTVTWTFDAEFRFGHWSVILSDSLTDVYGHTLDGEWDGPAYLGDTSGTSDFWDKGASGDGLNGGDFVFPFSLLLFGDANLDGVCDTLDYDIFADHWFNGGSTWREGDFNFNGEVDPGDFSLFSGGWFGAAQQWYEPTKVTGVKVARSGASGSTVTIPTEAGAADQLMPLPVYNHGMNQVIVTFSQPVIASAGDLTLTSASGLAKYSPLNATISPNGKTVTWTFDETIQFGEWIVTLSDSLTDVNGLPLDGEWDGPGHRADTSGTSSFDNGGMSGDGVYGGDFTFAFSLLLMGDANLDGIVNATDAAVLGSHWLMTGATWTDGDFNSDGTVDDEDAALYAAHTGNTLWSDALVVTSVSLANSGISGSEVAVPTAPRWDSSCQLKPLPVYDGVDQVILTFNRAVTTSPSALLDSLTLTDQRGMGTEYTPTSASVSPDGLTVTWTFATEFLYGEYTLVLSDAIMASGVPLDGEWDGPNFLGDYSSTSQFNGETSGDGVYGGDFVFDFSLLLPGDLNRSGTVTSADYATLTANLGMASGATWADGDFDFDGDVDAADEAILTANLYIGYWRKPMHVMRVEVANASVSGSAISVPTAAGADTQLLPLPVFDGVNQIILTFDTVVMSSSTELLGYLTLTDERGEGTQHTPTSVSLSNDDQTVTWTFATTFQFGEFVLNLSDAISGYRMVGGGTCATPLDGDWNGPRYLGDTSGTSQLGSNSGSGDGRAGGDFEFSFSLLLPGDATMDGRVNELDYAVFAYYWNSTNGDATWSQGDFNLDGDVDGFDFEILAGPYMNRQTCWPNPVPVQGPSERSTAIDLVLAQYGFDNDDSEDDVEIGDPLWDDFVEDLLMTCGIE